ncbi:MAG: hypothetical protein AAF085_06365 [Planctomycetota bacterium]
MSRQRKQTYRSSTLAELTRQLLYAPPEKRSEAVVRAERLHDELQPDNNYPIDFVVYRLTDRRVPPSAHITLVGEAILPDLRLLIDALSRTIDMQESEEDPSQTTKELAATLGVSTKTIARWRDDGLRWRWGERTGKPTVLITQSAVETYQRRNTPRISAAKGYSRISEQEKVNFINRARRLAQATNTPQMKLLSHLAKRTGRSIEALRLLILQHDTDHPDQAVFKEHTGPLTDSQKRMIDRAYANGETVSTLCGRFNKARPTIYRAIHEERARRACSTKIAVMPSLIYERDDADEVLMQAITRTKPTRRLGTKVLVSLPDSLKPVYERPIEADAVVRSLIVRYNYFKYQAAKIQRSISTSAPRASELDQFDELLGKIDGARGAIIAAMLPAILSIAKRQLTGKHHGDTRSLIRILWTAHQVLIEEIDRYDPAVAHSFESVLTNHLLRSLAGPIPADDSIDEASLIVQLTDAGFTLQN